MDFKTWRETHARRNKNMFIIDKKVEEESGKEKYIVYNEHNGKVTTNQVYGKTGNEYFGLKGESEVFYLKDFLLPGEEPKAEIVIEEPKKEIKSKAKEGPKDFEITFDVNADTIKVVQALKENTFVKNDDISIKTEFHKEKVRKILVNLEKDNIIFREPGKTKLLVSIEDFLLKAGGEK